MFVMVCVHVTRVKTVVAFDHR